MRILGSLLVALAFLLHLVPVRAETAVGDGQRIERNVAPAQRPGRRVPPIPTDALAIETGTLPVTIGGSAYTLQTLTVTPPGPGPFPLVVLSHGTPRDGSKRRGTRARTYLPLAEDFARRGYKAVAFATYCDRC